MHFRSIVMHAHSPSFNESVDHSGTGENEYEEKRPLITSSQMTSHPPATTSSTNLSLSDEYRVGRDENLILPSSLLPLSLDDRPNSPTSHSNTVSSSLIFASSQLFDGSSSTPTHTTPSPAAATGLTPSTTILGDFIHWLAPSPIGTAIPSASRQPEHGISIFSPSTTNNSLAPLNSSSLINTNQSSVNSAGTCFHWSVLGLLTLLVLLISIFIYESATSTQLHQSRLLSFHSPDAEQSQLDYESMFNLTHRSLEQQAELNSQLLQLSERDTKIHILTSELNRRDEVLVSYKKIVERLKTIQLEHDEMERKVREEAETTNSLILSDTFLKGLMSGDAKSFLSDGPGGSSDSTVDVARMKEKLIRLIFGNHTLSQIHSQHHDHSVSTHEDDILRLVKEESESSSKNSLMHEFLGVKPTEADRSVESVMRIQEGSDHRSIDVDEAGMSPSAKVQAPADKLIDSSKNEYILSKPGDSTVQSIDSRLVMDLGIVILASAFGGLFASFLSQPILLGYILGGSLIGPGGLGLIGQFIQIETLAQFGATFLLFALGVEFSLTKLRKVKHIALIGGGLQLGLIMLVVTLISIYLFELKVKTSIFLGSVLSMSSTTVVVKSLMEHKQIATLCGQVMLGLLIIQDVFLSLILALMNLARTPGEQLTEELMWLIGKFGILGIVVVCCMYLWPIGLRLLDKAKSPDLFLLGLIALCVFLTVVSETIIHSPEVGAFLSGLLISSSPGASPELTHRALRIFSPIRDMFGALFFSSIGMLINPKFLIENAVTILLLVLATLMLKSLITFLLVRLFGYSLDISIRTGLGLSQIGEFAFVLASEGLSVGLLTKELYFLLLGTTTVSIFITPGILTLSTWLVKYLEVDDRKVHTLGGTVD